jgi:hypothetical protein
MKSILLVLTAAGAAMTLGACTTAPVTAWGKPNVSKTEYGTDIGMCTGLAAIQSSGNAANTAGGLKRGGSALEPTKAGTPATSPVLMGGGIYRDSAPVEVSQRAASQQTAQEMETQRLRAEAYESCLSERGYQEFTLTPEQKAHLRTLKPGSNEYHEYLFSLGKDPAVLAAQKSTRSK